MLRAKGGGVSRSSAQVPFNLSASQPGEHLGYPLVSNSGRKYSGCHEGFVTMYLDR